MDLVLNEEQLMLQQSARDFFDREAPLSQLRGLRDSAVAEGYSRSTWRGMSEMGWPAMAVPQAYQGLGFGFTGLGVVLQEAGRTLTASPLLSSALMGVAALLRGASEEQKRHYLPAVASGEHLLTLANDERSGPAGLHIACRAETDADDYVLNGSKLSVLDGMTADTLIVSARTRGQAHEPDGVALFLVPRQTAGVAIARRQALDICVVADIELADVRVPGSALLGTAHGGHATLQYALDAGRIGQTAELSGLASEVFARTLAYLKERKQFGLPIGSFQALQHRAAILFGELELCKSLVIDALHCLDEAREDLAETASASKAKVSEIAMLSAAEAIQMHGGIGMTDDFDIGFFYKRARILETLLGDRYYHLDRFARCRGY